MKLILITALIASTSNSAFAAADQISLLRCPAVPEGFTKMITDLGVLKGVIKKEAGCEAAQTQVTDLESLIGQRRQQVVDIVTRGKTEVLETADMNTVRTYVEDVTKKVFSTAELLDRNDYCFAEDKRELGLSDLASITLDATALAKAVAGPWAAPIALGGQALVGIMQGLDKVVKTKGYDFEKIDQRQSYVQSLCTYYNYRQDIEHLLYPKRRTAELLQLNRRLQKGLESITKGCEGCREIVALDNQRFTTPTGTNAPTGAEFPRPTNPSSPSDINRAVTTTNSNYRQPLGSYTLQMLNSLRWAQGEIDRIKAEVENDRSLGRDLISETKADIDRFLFEKEAPLFIQFQSEKAMNLYKEFSSFVMKESRRLVFDAARHAPVTVEMINPMDEVEAVSTLLTLVEPLEEKGQTSLLARISDFQRKATDLLDRTNIAVEAQSSYCTFFRQASIYGSDLQKACDSYEARTVEKRLVRLERLKSPKDGFDPQLFQTSQPKEAVVDWADGVAKFMDKLDSDPAVFSPR